MRLPKLILLLTATLLVPVAMPLSSVAAQNAPVVRTLSKPETEFAEPFSAVVAIRELADGRVLVSDSKDKIVQVVDLKAGRATKVGREGAGPGEYGLPAQLFPLPGDSSVVFDPLNSRYLVILPSGKPGATFRVGDDGPKEAGPAGGRGPVIMVGGLGLGMPKAVDARGRLYFEGPPLAMGPNGPMAADSVPVMRYDRGTRRADTLTWVHLPSNSASVKSSGSGNSRSMEVRIGGRTPYPARDGWTVLPNGTVVVARVKDYHLDVIAAAGSSTRGPAVRFTPVPVGSAEKQEYRDAVRSSPGISISRNEERGPGGTRSQVSTAPPPFQEPESWPATKPPFDATRLLATPTGEVWVQRYRSASEPAALYDVFSATGALTGQIALPPKTRVVGFGNGGAIYTIRTDSDDLQYLQRFRR
jgi:hypothetical protein